MPLVFISYNRKDGKYAKALSDQLKARGISVFLDVDSIAPSQQFPKATAESIAKCDLLLLLWSHNSAASHFVTEEWNIALACKKAIFPVLLDDCLLPAALTAINAWQWSSAVKLANRVVGLVMPGAVPPAPPPEPLQKRRLVGWFLGAVVLAVTVLGVWKIETVPPFAASNTGEKVDTIKTNPADSIMSEGTEGTVHNSKPGRTPKTAFAPEKTDVKIDTIKETIVEDTTAPIKPVPDNLLREPLVLKGKIYLEDPPGTGIPHVEIYATEKNGHRMLIEPIFTNDAGNYELIVPAGNIKPDRIWVDGRDAGYGKKDFPFLGRTTKLDYPLEKRPR